MLVATFSNPSHLKMLTNSDKTKIRHVKSKRNPILPLKIKKREIPFHSFIVHPPTTQGHQNIKKGILSTCSHQGYNKLPYTMFLYVDKLFTSAIAIESSVPHEFAQTTTKRKWIKSLLEGPTMTYPAKDKDLKVLLT